MSRTLTGSLAAHLATGRLSLARCLRLDLIDGTSLGFTSLDQDIDVDLGDGVLTYSAVNGVVPSSISLSLGWDADNFEAAGAISAVMTRAAVLGGRYRGARFRLVEVNHQDVTQWGPLIGGKVANPKVEGGRYVLEMRGHVAAYNQKIGRVLSPGCDADFGDARCGATPQTWAATVAAVNSDLSIDVTFTGLTPTADEAQGGEITFVSGALVGTYKVDVFTLSGSTVALYVPFVESPQVGDALTLAEGCDKLRATCILKQGDATNFRGFPDLTGNDQYMQFPTPGVGS